VIDVSFPARLPAVHSELRAGLDGKIVIEVVTQLNQQFPDGQKSRQNSGHS
jgi:hypothetical protein